MVRVTQKKPTKLCHKPKPSAVPFADAACRAFIYDTMKATYPNMKLSEAAIQMLTAAAAKHQRQQQQA